jgi:3-oxoacyl-(acyl-carrier-protein) synthase
VCNVAVTGVGVVSALGLGAGPFWEGLVAGRSGLGPIGRFTVPGGAHGGEVKGLEVRAFAHSPQARRIDRTSLFALAACRLAVEDAGGLPAGLDPTRTGIALGSALGNLGETAVFLDRLFSRGVGNALVFANLVLNAPLSYASIELGITGPTAFVTEQEASGEAAIAWGARLVADGAVDVCLAGATDELDSVRYEVLRDAGVLAEGPPRPLDPGATGSCPGEGAAVVVLEPLAAARARGARVYARLAPQPGFAVPAPGPGGPREAEAGALAPVVGDADLIVAAASGRPELDALEVAALARALGDGRRRSRPRAVPPATSARQARSRWRRPCSPCTRAPCRRRSDSRARPAAASRS